MVGRKNPYRFISSYNEKRFQPFIKAIGQSSLLWNDLHEWLGHLYCNAIGGGVVNAHLRVWHSIANDRAKRDMLLAAAQITFVETPPVQSSIQKNSFEAIKWIFDRSNELEQDRNNVIHAPLWASQSDDAVYPASAFGNQRAKNLEGKFLLAEYRRLRDTARLLRNFTVALHDPMNDERLPWPDKPRLPDRGATKKPPIPPHLAKIAGLLRQH